MDGLELDRATLGQIIQAATTEAVRQLHGGSMHAWIAKRESAWVVYWLEDGQQRQKTCGPGQAGRALAKKLQVQINAELVLGKKPLTSSVPWADFLEEYRVKVLELASPAHKRSSLLSLENFRRTINPTNVGSIKSRDLDAFKAARAKERSKQYKRPVSPASVNLDLRNVMAALKRAKRWGYLVELPTVEKMREPDRLPEPVPADAFPRLYGACEHMTLPRLQGITPAAWWRAMIVMAYSSGWRKSELLGLERIDLNLESGVAIIRQETSKGQRDEAVPLNSWALEHLRELAGFSRHVLEWPHHIRTFSAHWYKLQRLAGLEKRHKFHAFRSSFCSVTAAGLSLVARQKLARHKSSSTTAKHYVNPTAEVLEAVEMLTLPRQDCARAKARARESPGLAKGQNPGFLEESA